MQRGLIQRWSPEQISRVLHREYPDRLEMQVAPEAIYQALYVQGRGALRRELTAALRTGRTRRKPHRHPDSRRDRFDFMVMIADRPAEADDRAVPGHWEGDLIIGAGGRSAIGTLVERSTRFVVLLPLPAGRTAEAVRDAIVSSVATLPRQLRRSLTWDQGSEMARHGEITLAVDLPVFFCDPASPWQRGSNENINGLLRQYSRRAPTSPPTAPNNSPRSLSNSTADPARPSTGTPPPNASLPCYKKPLNHQCCDDHWNPPLSTPQAGALLHLIRPVTVADTHRKDLARDLLADVRRLDTAIKASTKSLSTALEAAGGTLTQVHGLGPVLAAKIVAHSGDVSRFPSRHHYAS